VVIEGNFCAERSAEEWLNVRNARLRSEAAHFVLKRVEGSECAAAVVAIEVTPRAW
jgi:hypothetical protein